MKCGTTAMYRYLAAHPRFAAPEEKELHYFDVNFDKGPRWYAARFPIAAWMSLRRGRPVVSGEASPYYLYHPLAALRARDECPDARIIAIVRDPVARAYSHYQQNRRLGFETLSFEDAIDAEPERLAGESERLLADPGYRSLAHQTHSYLARGEYAGQLQRWITLFGRSRVLVLESHTLDREPWAAHSQALRFLELEALRLPAYRRVNAAKYPPMKPTTHERLRAHFAPQDAQLATLLGAPPSWTPRASHSPAAELIMHTRQARPPSIAEAPRESVAPLLP